MEKKSDITHLVFNRFSCTYSRQCGDFLDDSTKKATASCSFLYYWKFSTCRYYKFIHVLICNGDKSKGKCKNRGKP